MENEEGIEVPHGTFIEDKFNYLKDVAKYNHEIVSHLLSLIDMLAEGYKLIHTHLSNVIYSQLDSEISFDREGLDKFVWTITSIEDDETTTLKVARTEIHKEEDESNNSSSGIE